MLKIAKNHSPYGSVLQSINNGQKTVRITSEPLEKENRLKISELKLAGSQTIGAGAQGKLYDLVDNKGNHYAGKIHTEYTALEKEKSIYEKLGHHLHIAKYYGTQKIGNDNYLVLEKINGSNLRTFINNLDKFCRDFPSEANDAPAIRLMLTEQLFSALNFFQKKGLSHSDLKPENIMINNEGKIKLIDFELAKDTKKDIVGSYKGTTGYISPETIPREQVNYAKADGYALANIILEMLGGFRLSQNRSTFIHSAAENNTQQAVVTSKKNDAKELSPNLLGPSGAFFLEDKNQHPINQYLLNEVIMPLHIADSSKRAALQDISPMVQEMAKKYLDSTNREKALGFFKTMNSYIEQQSIKPSPLSSKYQWQDHENYRLRLLGGESPSARELLKYSNLLLLVT